MPGGDGSKILVFFLLFFKSLSSEIIVVCFPFFISFFSFREEREEKKEREWICHCRLTSAKEPLPLVLL